VALWCEILAFSIGLFDWSFAMANLLLAAAEEPGLLSRVGSQFYIWGSVALGLGLVIFVHELGHFLAAKMFGVKVEKFYVGFDVPIQIGPIKFPRTLGKFRYGETEYGIGIIPLGGYVKMLGQDDDPRNMEKESQRIRAEAAAAGEEDADEAFSPSREELDPRSYPAKSVGQRMVIISAGVVMNVLTGILFAAFAYGVLGVDYTPAVVGATSPGDPAYQAGIEPGGRVLAIDGDDPAPQMHFSRMTLKILTHGIANPETPVDLLLEYPDGTRQFQVMTEPDPWNPGRRMIGISSPALAKLDKEFYAEEQTPAAAAFTEADAGAEIIAVAGESLEVNSVLDVTLNDRVAQYLMTHPDQDVTLTLRRADEAQTVADVTIAPRMMKSLGFELGVGPVDSLVKDGPAAKAGIEVGDQIVSIEGIDTLSALRLPLEIQALEGPVQVTLRRGTGDAAQEIQVKVEPIEPLATLPPYASQAGRIAIYPLGLAYFPTPIISQSTTEFLQPGDVLNRVTVKWPEGKRPEWLDKPMYQAHLERLEKGWDATEISMLSSLVTLTQKLPEGTRLRVIGEQADDKKIIDTQTSVTVSDAFWPERGIIYAPVRFTHRADGAGEALALGWREGKWKMGEVFQFLRLLVSGKVSRNQVGGPLKIANIAASQAEQGWSPLLMFLTMLSMNLAILNFLPIPALDGGHMVFLIAEAVMGRPVDEQLQMKLTMGGVLALLSLMIFVFANDIITWQ